MTVGSSPHTRGLRDEPVRLLARVGIIPAHAGFTPPTPSGGGGSRDHPRTRGVYEAAGAGDTGKEGSSPHTRGLRGRPRRAVRRVRIIPAHAGFTRGP